MEETKVGLWSVRGGEEEVESWDGHQLSSVGDSDVELAARDRVIPAF